MTLAPFAYPSDLNDLIDVSAPMDSPKAVLVLSAASEACRLYTKQTLNLVQDDAARLMGNATGRLELPEKPVVSVASVVLNDTPVDFTLDGHNDLLFGTNTILATMWGPDPDVGDFGGPGGVVIVTYTHGFDPIPDSIKMATLMIAARIWERPGDAGGMSAETLGQYSYRLGSAIAAEGLIGAERTYLDPYKRKVRTTVT